MAEEWGNTKPLISFDDQDREQVNLAYECNRKNHAKSYLAGYKAAMEQVEYYKAQADKWRNELSDLNYKYAAKCEAYAEKCAEDEGRHAIDQVVDANKVMNSPEKPDSWISVKDRLPPPQTEVLWWNKAAQQAGVSSWEYMSYCDDTMIEWGDAGNVSIRKFTHWQPLPEPPKEGE